MGKQYNISGILDGYTDNEFLIEGEAGADTEAVLNGVMAKVEPKKRLRLGMKIFAAAAVVGLMSVIVGASLPKTVYQLADGTIMSLSEGYIEYDGNSVRSDYDNIYIVENGRVYFTFDGQHIDITDSIDFDNAYCYRSDIVDSIGETHERWIAVGGTPEHIGWIEAIADSNGIFRHSSLHGDFEYYQYYVDDEVLTFWELDGEYEAKYPSRTFQCNWVRTVCEKFTPDADSLYVYYEHEFSWKYPYNWTGETIDVDIPKPENIAYFA